MSALTAERRGSLAITSAAIIWGFWGVAVHVAQVSGIQAACISLFSIAIFALPTLPRRIPRGWAMWWPLLATGVTDAANALLYFEALHRGPVPIAVLSHYLAPVLVALLSPLMLRQRPSLRVILALPIALVGLGFLLGEEVLHLGAGAITGALGAASALFYALQVLIQKRSGHVLTPAELIVWHAFVSGFILLPFALQGPAPDLGGAAILIGSAAIGGAFAGSVFLWGLRHVNAAKAGVLTYIEPMVGVAAGALILGHGVPAWAPLGGGLILAAGLWVLREKPAGDGATPAPPPAPR
jgi:drug/metabolite transporter (DMT)-like permease